VVPSFPTDGKLGQPQCACIRQSRASPQAQGRLSCLVRSRRNDKVFGGLLSRAKFGTDNPVCRIFHLEYRLPPGGQCRTGGSTLKLHAALAVILFLAAAPLLVAQGAFSQLAYPGASATYATSVNAQGTAVGYYLDTSGNYHGYQYDLGFAEIDYPGAQSTMLTGINDQFEIVGVAVNPTLAFVYDELTNSFGELSYPGAAYTYVSAISDTGVIVGSFGSSAAGPSTGFQYYNGTYTAINPPSAVNSYVTGVADNGILVGSYYTSATGTLRNFNYKQGVYQQIVIPDSHHLSVLGINPFGNTLVGEIQQSGQPTYGFGYKSNTVTSIEFQGSPKTVATGINGTGIVVGYYSDPDTGVIYGFSWMR
jgi:hypothetical protein